MAVRSSKLQIERKILLFVCCSFVAYRSTKRREQDWKVILKRIAFSRLFKSTFYEFVSWMQSISRYNCPCCISWNLVERYRNQHYGSSTNFWSRFSNHFQPFQTVFQCASTYFIFGVFFLPSFKHRHIAKILNLDTYMDVSSGLQQILGEL